jgi:hypothetical protein
MATRCMPQSLIDAVVARIARDDHQTQRASRYRIDVRGQARGHQAQIDGDKQRFTNNHIVVSPCSPVDETALL